MAPRKSTAHDQAEGRHIDPATRDNRLPRSTRVLVVDDSRDNADSLALLLRAQGAEAQCAYDGTEGLEKARSWLPQVALIDIGLPDMPGYEVARAIRAEPTGGRMLLLAVTGFGDPSTEEKVREAGFDERLVKPIDYERLRALIAGHGGAAGA